MGGFCHNEHPAKIETGPAMTGPQGTFAGFTKKICDLLNYNHDC
jgi:hypothetical protein